MEGKGRTKCQTANRGLDCMLGPVECDGTAGSGGGSIWGGGEDEDDVLNQDECSDAGYYCPAQCRTCN